MNVCIYYYDDFCEFEAVFTALLFKGERLVTTALEDRTYISEETQKFIPDTTVDQLEPEEIDLFIIPGGEPAPLYNDSTIKNFLLKMNQDNKYIAGICGGTKLMAKFGLLDNHRCNGSGAGIGPDYQDIDLFKNAQIVDQGVVVDGNIITATGESFLKFAVKLGEIMDGFENKERFEKIYTWLKSMA